MTGVPLSCGAARMKRRCGHAAIEDHQIELSIAGAECAHRRIAAIDRGHRPRMGSKRVADELEIARFVVGDEDVRLRRDAAPHRGH